ncbi:MAG TPA: endo-1,4-beta-xylanase [Candidatus Limnocylindrales bacterium]
MRFRNGSRGSTLAVRLGLAAAVSIGLVGCGSQAATSSPAGPSLSPSVAPTATLAPTATPVPVNLKDISGTRYFGTAVNDRLLGSDAEFTKLLNAQFSQVTAENAMKWGPLEPTQGNIDWTAADALVASAQANGQKVRGHTLVWHSQLPTFISDGHLTKAQLNDTVKAHIEAEMGRYKGKIYAWDVVNEAFNDDGTMRQSVFETTLGDGYIADAFRWAHAADPAAKLYINDYDTDDINPKSDGLYALVKKLKADGVPIDGVGFQAHLDLENNPPAKMAENLQRFAALGVEVAITELDVRLATPSTPDKLKTQADYYKLVVEACVSTPACVGITVWGISDRDSWVPMTFPGKGDADLYDASFKTKPAYDAVVQALEAAAK